MASQIPLEDLIVVEERINKRTGETTTTNYQKGRYLGKGGFAKCYEFMNMTTKKFTAAKIIPKANLTKSSAQKKLMSEINIHRRLRHSNIVGFEHFFEDSDNVYILLELCTNQTMSKLLKRRKRLTEIEVQCYLLQILSGLNYLHGHKIIHRDLKLDNFFISENMEVKLGDFGLAAVIRHEGEKRNTKCGTPNYIAPEVLGGKGHSYEVDVWAVGIVAYTLLVGKPPFETTEIKTTYRRIKMNAFSYPENVIISDVSKDLINRILITDPASRLTLSQIQMHEFFHQANTIPKVMPASALACPPSSNFLKLYMPAAQNLANNSSKIHESSQNLSKVSPRNLRDDKEVVLTDRTEKKEAISRHLMSPVENGNEVTVNKWVDYSNKYGLGYLLSNGAIGVVFNDSTKILIHSRREEFIYYERQSGENVEIGEVFDINEAPNELNKKIRLLNHFKICFEEDSKREGEVNGNQNENSVYVKKWIKTKNAILFRLSNKIVQVIFKDRTEIILSSESRIVTYKNKLQEQNIYQLSSALESNNPEMIKRLKYTKELIVRMQNNNREHEAD